MFISRIKAERALDRRLSDVESSLIDLRKEFRGLSDDLEYTQTTITRLRGTITGGRRGKPAPEEENGQAPTSEAEINLAIREGRFT